MSLRQSDVEIRCARRPKLKEIAARDAAAAEIIICDDSRPLRELPAAVKGWLELALANKD